MNLTWHIIKKDLTRLRVPLLIWLALLAGQVLISPRLLSLRSSDANWYMETGMLFNVLVAFTLLVAFILAAALVLADPLVGAEMFWVTRPISGARLLRAKLGTALLIFGAIPVAMWIPWWLFCDFGLAQMAHAAWRVLWVQALAVVPAFVLASLAGQSSRFVLGSIVTSAAAWVVVLNFVTWDGFHSLSPRLLETRLILTGGLLALFGAGVVWRQYTSRHFGSSSVILAVGIVLASVTMLAWPWSIATLWPDRSAPPPGSEAIAVEIRDAYLTPISNSGAFSNSGSPESVSVTIRVLCKSLPEDFLLAGGLARVRLQWPDGLAIVRDDLWLSPGGPERYESVGDQPMSRALGASLRNQWQFHWDPETRAKMAEMRQAWLERMGKSGQQWRRSESRPGEEILQVSVAVTPAVAARLRTNPPACSISVRLALQQPEVLFEMPWTADTQNARRGARLHMLGLAPHRRWSYALPDQQGQKGKAYMTTVVCALAPGLGSLQLYNVNRVHGTFSFLGSTQAFTALPVAAAMQAQYLDFLNPRMWRTDTWVDGPDWLATSTLAAVVYRPAGGFSRDLHVDWLAIRGEND